MILTFAGTIAGMILGHLGLSIIGYFQESSQARLTGFLFLNSEIYILAAGLAIGIFAAALPAVQAYKANISRILAKN